MVRDRLGRPLESLRVSVTDRCNLRCGYCMPEEEYVWLPRDDLLGFEEIERLVSVFAGLGVSQLRLTGGEPLVRRSLPELVARLARIEGIEDLALTSNGVLLEEHAPALAAAGLSRVTVSLDSVDRERFREVTQRDELPRVLAGLQAALAAGLGLKLNTVVIRGVNDEDLPQLIELGKRLTRAYQPERPVEARFIEYMDVGGATRWSTAQVVSRGEVLARLAEFYGPIEPLNEGGSAPAERFRLPDGTLFGVIASTTAPFCRTCDRARVTADGRLFLCLYARDGLDLRGPLREGASDAELSALIRSTWEARDDRGAEQRLALGRRMPLAGRPELQADPHLEMHTRGG